MSTYDEIVDVVDGVTSLPGRVARGADNVNDWAIEKAEQLQAALEASGNVAEENLTRNKIESLGRRAGSWASEPRNMVITGVVLFAGAVLIGIISRSWR